MKCSKLIEALKEYNPDADVTTPYSEDICIGYIDNEEEYDKHTTPIIFIEGCDEYLECTSEYIHEENDILWCEHYDRPCKDKTNCDYFEEFVNPY